jgi:Zn-finger nucleic acid-binding protein
LERESNRCPYCQVFNEVDLKQIAFRDLGTVEPAMSCPACRCALHHLQIDLEPPVTLERCGGCQGLFFNPGELEYVLNAQTNPVVVLDYQQIDGLVSEVSNPGEIRYRKCPGCSERMSPHNFGGRSGVIPDKCGSHGYWLDGGELRRLAEWWRVGGKHLHQQNEVERVRKVLNPPAPRRRSTGTIESLPDTSPSTPWEFLDVFDVVRIVASLLTSWR